MDVLKPPAPQLVRAASISGPSLPKEAGFSSFSEKPVADQQLPQDSADALDTALTRLRDRMQTIQRDLDFSIDESTGEVVVKVIDGESGKVVRQIPSEEVLRLAEKLDDMRSLLFNTKA